MLKEKVIIVTGGSGLIGKEILKDIKKKDGIALNADINVETNLAECTLNLDITNKESIIDAINCVYNYFGRIDGLVNNAYPRTKDWGARFEDVELDSWAKNVEMQLNSTFFLCQQVLKIMSVQKAGSIVNIASIYGVVGNDFTLYEEYGGTSPSAYSAIKGGVINFTRYLSSYFGPQNIRINCVSPGGILDESQQQPSFIRRFKEKVPMRRMGNPDDIAPAVSFMLSDEAKYITGQNLVVDGGWTAI